MLGELGHLALVFALVVTVIIAVVPLIGVARNDVKLMTLARTATYAQWLFVACSYFILTLAFYLNDFSIAYIAKTSNLNQPTMYRLSGVWGGHEGSLLLWILMLSSWSALVAKFSKSIPLDTVARVLAVLGMVSIGFMSFTLFTSNPFDRLFPVPLDGQELNPLLQDPGFLIHPPMLYMGYVGFSVVFAFAIAAMLAGKLDTAWARWARPWTLVAWAFLTIGITLGSWWAYYELGWGGWWFWDPVENASFMPWLVGTALIHSLVVTEKRSAFKSWTALLAIRAFSLSLLGTFLVRSGVLTSVHAFATDPTRGLFILIFLLIVVGGSLGLYAVQSYRLRSTTQFNLVSKESALFVNNLLLMITAFMVLIGTLQPLFVDALTGQKISVGPPYFDAMFVLLMVPLTIIIGIGSMGRWKNDKLTRFGTSTLLLAAASMAISALVTGLLSPDGFQFAAFLGLALGIWVFFWALYAGFERLAYQKNKWLAIRSTPASIWGMMMAHIGVAIFVIGVTHVNSYSLEKDVKLSPGDTYSMGNYQFTFNGVERISEANYGADQGRFLVAFLDGPADIELMPQKRYYSSNNPMTEAAIDTTLSRDVYVSLGEHLGDGAWSVRLYIRSFVACIWVGGFFMAFGAFLATFDRRFRVERKAKRDAIA
ncbi:MAG: heme lyase CcmF/NrfE family subunit [Pseudomonadota bacterium]